MATIKQIDGASLPKDSFHIIYENDNAINEDLKSYKVSAGQSISTLQNSISTLSGTVSQNKSATDQEINNIKTSIINLDFQKKSTNAGTAGQVLTSNGDNTYTYKTPSGGGGTGDMEKSVYDPNSVNSDVFDMDNMSESLTKKILSDAERTAISNNTANNHSHANKSILDGISQSNIDQWNAGGGVTPYKYGLEVLKQADVLTNENILNSMSTFTHDLNKYALVTVKSDGGDVPMQPMPTMPNMDGLPPIPSGDDLPPLPPLPGASTIKIIKIDSQNKVTEVALPSFIDFMDDDIFMVNYDNKVYLVGSTTFVEGTIETDGTITFGTNQSNMFPSPDSYTESVTVIKDTIYATISGDAAGELYESVRKGGIRQPFTKMLGVSQDATPSLMLGFEYDNKGYIFGSVMAQGIKGVLYEVSFDVAGFPVRKLKEIATVAGTTNVRGMFRLGTRCFVIENFTECVYSASTNTVEGVASTQGTNFYPIGKFMNITTGHRYDSASESLFYIDNGSIYTVKFNK